MLTPLLILLADASASPTLVSAGGGHWGVREWIAVAAVAALAVGLALRFAAGRRLRRGR